MTEHRDTEDTTKPRWRCEALGLVEHCRPTDCGADAARRRLQKRVEQLYFAYRAGVVFGRLGQGGVS